MFEALHEGEVNAVVADVDPSADTTPTSPMVVRVRFSSDDLAERGMRLLKAASADRSWRVQRVGPLEVDVVDGSA